MSDLLPCPFCGNVKLLYIEHMKETILHPYRVVCDNCGAAGGYQDIGNHIKAWNRRALPAVQPDAAAIREAALREAASYHEVMAADEDALSAKYRGGSSPWFAHAQRASWHREHASAILALKGESHE